MSNNVFILGASSDIGKELIKIFSQNNYSITAHCNTNNKSLIEISKKFKKIKIIKKNF